MNAEDIFSAVVVGICRIAAGLTDVQVALGQGGRDITDYDVSQIGNVVAYGSLGGDGWLLVSGKANAEIGDLLAEF